MNGPWIMLLAIAITVCPSVEGATPRTGQQTERVLRIKVEGDLVDFRLARA
jgi:hypothetical protein